MCLGISNGLWYNLKLRVDMKTKFTRNAVYPASFDPFTLGHLEILHQAKHVFDHVTLLIGDNPTKKSYFTVEERLSFLIDITKSYDNVSAAYLGNRFVVDYALENSYDFMIRGLRNVNDFVDEFSRSQINKQINSFVTTVTFMAEKEYADISSSMVKSLIGYENWENVVKKYLPGAIHDSFFKIVKQKLDKS